MSGVNNVDSNILAQLGLNAPASEKKNELGQDEFLALMVAQLRNQNPLEPESNSDFIAEMAQFGTVDGIKKLREEFSTLNLALTSNQALQATSLVGRTVYVSSNAGQLNAGEGLKGAVELPQSVADLQVSIYSSTGELVRTISLGDKASGSIDFTWDGIASDGNAAPEGVYTIQADALSDGERRAFGTLIAANVESVTLGNTSKDLKLSLTGIGLVSIDQVKQIN